MNTLVHKVVKTFQELILRVDLREDYKRDTIMKTNERYKV